MSTNEDLDEGLQSGLTQEEGPAFVQVLAVDIANVALLIGLSFLLYFWHLDALPFYERGEGREGLVVWEMVHSGNWILPRVNGEYIPFKPPLFHWLGAVAATVSGQLNEFVIRFPSALLATLGVWLTYWAGSRWWDRRAGLAAALILVTSFGWWQAATIAQVDMVLSFFVSAALLLFYSLYRFEKRRTFKALALAALLALATLAKGPLGMAAPALVIGLFLLLRKDIGFITRLPLLAGAVVYLAVAGSWYALAYGQDGWAFVQRQLIEETLLTGVGDYGRHQPLYYYLPVVFYNLIPWSFFFPALAIFLYQRRARLAADNLLYPLLWFLAILLFYSLARGKRGIYMLPLYPAIALLLGRWWSVLGADKETSTRPARWLGWLYAISCATVLLGIGYYTFGDGVKLMRHFSVLSQKLQAVGLVQADGQSFAGAATYAAVLLAMLVVLLAVSLRRGSWAAVFASLAGIATVQLVLVRTLYFPHFVAPRTLKPFIAEVRQKVAPSAPLVFYRGFDGAAIFYSDRHVRQYEAVRDQLRVPYYLLIWQEDFERIGRANGLERVAISAGKGPALRHHLVLAKASSGAPLVDNDAPADAKEE